jgi:hypothetical protein
MEGKEVDPAALLVAVLTVVAGPLLTAGSWDKLNTVIAVVVLVIIIAYSLTPTSQKAMSPPQQIAVSLVIGLIIAIAVAWPIQSIIIHYHWPVYHFVNIKAAGRIRSQRKIDDDATANRATAIAIQFGLMMALILWVWLSRKLAPGGPSILLPWLSRKLRQLFGRFTSLLRKETSANSIKPSGLGWPGSSASEHRPRRD